MEVVCAFDLGKKNPARTIFEINGNSIKLIDISKLDWSTNWEKKVADDISKYNYTSVLLERQPKRSPYVKFIYFIKGFLYNTFTKVICVSPVMSGKSYKDRKKRSIEVFLNWMTVFGLKKNIPKKKLDDVADSFNLAMRYILNKWKISYKPYIKNKKN
ncbi:114R protein [Yaba-like disease virus]|uniref:114R protein n=1 Tax=Yaba-like disease virus TaxID=132475 RepID=Q9DHJ9_YLDV|nr:114R protein [Yaba-like disease virus]CAC21352.1 114R protein [Yaba-like disease virus]